MNTHAPRGPECLAPETMAAFAEGGLTAGEREQIETHVAGCDDCYEALLETATAMDALGIAPVSAASIAPAPATNRRAAYWVGALAVAASVLLLINVWAGRPDALDTAVAALARDGRDARIALGRLSFEQTWAKALPGGDRRDTGARRSGSRVGKFAAVPAGGVQSRPRARRARSR